MSIKIGISGSDACRQVWRCSELYRDDFDLVLVNDLTDPRPTRICSVRLTYGRFDGTSIR
jgi:hypothetical protein